MVSAAYREQRRLMVVTEARQVEDGSGHRMVIAANEVSRNGDDLNLRGISFKDYRKNPVVLSSHDSWDGIPIAKTLKIGHDDQGRIVADCQGRCENVPAGRSKTVPVNAVEWASRFVGRWRSGSVR